jgi:hypothetical protein
MPDWPNAGPKRGKIGVVFEQEWEISLECQPIGIWPKNALESGDKPDGVTDSRLVESLRSP